MLTFSLSFLSLFLFSTWYQSHFLVAFTRQNLASLCYYRFTVSSLRSQTLLPFLPSSESSSPSCCLTQNHLHWIDLIKICPLSPESAGSGFTCALTRRQKSLILQPCAHALSRAATCPHGFSRKFHFLSLFSHLALPGMGFTSCHEITHPITIILDGPASYHAWSQNMIVFLKGRRL